MKKLVFGFLATVMITGFCFGQTSNTEWLDMMGNYKTSIDNIIMKECPKDIDLNEFKVLLIKGQKILSKNAQKEVIAVSESIKKYGLEFAQKNKLNALEDSDLIFYSSFSPDIKVENGELLTAKVGADSGITGADIVNCAISALGADALYSLAVSGGTSWSIAALTTTFTNVAKRFLGPLGVGIAVVSFGLCLHQAYIN